MGEPRYRRIAQRLYSDLYQAHAGKADYVRLKPLKDLSREYETSFGTIKRAVHHLIREGRCIKRGARSFFLVWKGPPISPRALPRENAESRLAMGIRAAILSGEYRTGMQLPKTGYFTLTHNISPHTVSGAMKLLHGEGLIYKQGKKWIVGNPAIYKHSQNVAHAKHTYQFSRPVVLIIVRNPNHYADLSTDHLYQGLSETLLSELSLNAYETAVCFVDRIDPVYNCVSGLDAIIGYARELGNRYVGAIVLGSELVFSPRLLQGILSLNQPVLWFDPNDLVQQAEFAALRSCRNLIACRLDKKHSIHLALQFLHNGGHRRIGVPDPVKLTTAKYHRSWITQRVRHIKSTARHFSPPLTCIVRFQERFPFSDRPSHERYSNLWKPVGTAPPVTERHSGQVAAAPSIHALPGLYHLIRECGVSALCACNDFFARDYFYWLGRVGVSVPGDVSLISFDNSFVASSLGLTSVDFGLVYLAGQMAGVLMGRLPPPVGKPATIWSRPWLVSRRSVKMLEG